MSLPVEVFYGLYWLDDDHRPHRVTTEAEYRMGWDPERRRVAKTTVGEAEVSTVFLCLDHRYLAGPPVLFESMVFGGEHDEYQRRYHTWAEAEAGHAAIVAALTSGTDPDGVVR